MKYISNAHDLAVELQRIVAQYGNIDIVLTVDDGDEIWSANIRSLCVEQDHTTEDMFVRLVSEPVEDTE